MSLFGFHLVRKLNMDCAFELRSQRVFDHVHMLHVTKDFTNFLDHVDCVSFGEIVYFELSIERRYDIV